MAADPLPTVPTHHSYGSSSDRTSEKDLPSGTTTPTSTTKHVPPLATRKAAYDSDLQPITDWFAHHLHIRRRREGDLDDIATQHSVFDTDQAAFFQPRADWENINAFDPAFRWTWREEKKVLRKVDWRILSWVCVMFFALDIDRYNISAGEPKSPARRDAEVRMLTV